MSTLLKTDARGAVTLPAELCRAAGVAPGTELVADVQDGRIVLERPRRPIWEEVVALTADIPPEEFNKLPPGGAALALYEARPDKSYSLTDCRSMLAMRALGLTEALTNDHHFTQEGFTILFS